jgi:nucleoside-diphosphate-sugar epimerase
MKVLVTGAGGFLGSAVVNAALHAGHEVLALRRPASAPPENTRFERLTWLSADLRESGKLSERLAGVEGVIHCAAAASGDLAAQLSGTVLATENLLAELPANLHRFVHVSSFSVYDFDAPGFRGTLSEQTPLETRPSRRDSYTQTKLIQERLVREYAAARDISVVVARPGAIYGPGKTWDFGSSLSICGLDLILAPLSRMRLIHVSNCANALVAALTLPTNGELIVNLVDPEQPSHWRLHRLARRYGLATAVGVPIPYSVLLALGRAARLTSRLFFRSRARLPELFDPPRQRARWRPLRYSRDSFEQLFDQGKRVSLQTGVAAMAGTVGLAASPDR